MPQRAFKANPVMQTRDATTKRRRDMFFKRVQNNRDDKKWESRGEQVRDMIIQTRVTMLICNTDPTIRLRLRA